MQGNLNNSPIVPRRCFAPTNGFSVQRALTEQPESFTLALGCSRHIQTGETFLEGASSFAKHSFQTNACQQLLIANHSRFHVVQAQQLFLNFLCSQSVKSTPCLCICRRLPCIQGLYPAESDVKMICYIGEGLPDSAEVSSSPQHQSNFHI